MSRSLVTLGVFAVSVTAGVMSSASCGRQLDEASHALARSEVSPPSPPPSAEREPQASPTHTGVDGSLHVALGIPKDGDDSDDVLLDKTAYVVSYNPRLNVPNWVAWHLDAKDLGKTKRSGKFHSETALPPSLYVVLDSDYARSGYDRGHLCPSADRTASLDTNRATFVFSNTHPQRHELNAGPWEKLETHERELVHQGNALFIVAGGVFDADPKRIGKDPDEARRVAVPKASYKLLIVLKPGQSAAAVSADTPVIAAIMPNDRSTRDRDYTDYLTSIRDIERATGYDYLTRIPRAIQDVVESRRP